MKKIIGIMAIIIIIAIAFCIIYIKTTPTSTEDALRFKTEYEALNGEKIELTIPANNPMKYINVKEAVEVLKNGSAIMYIGYPSCTPCRTAVPNIIEVAKQLNIGEVLYLNIKEYDNSFKVQDGEVVKTREEAEGYYELLEEAKEITREYIIREGEEYYEVGETRIYSPTILKIENGEITKFKTGNSYSSNSENEENELVQEYIELMK